MLKSHKRRASHHNARDFRLQRTRLPDEAFAIVTKAKTARRDLIDKQTWRSIVSLPDDVSLQTSDHYGTCLRYVWEYWGAWVEITGVLSNSRSSRSMSPILQAALAVGDEFQASIYNALTGYYRTATATLRSVVEQITVGGYLEISGNSSLAEQWRSQGLGFTAVTKLLTQTDQVKVLETAYQLAVGDDLFHPKNRNVDEGGLMPRVFSTLNRYVHTQPKFTDGDIRRSNGPIFVPRALGDWYFRYLLVYAYAVLMVRLSCPNLSALGAGSKYSLQSLFDEVVGLLPDKYDGKKLLANTPPQIWSSPPPKR